MTQVCDGVKTKQEVIDETLDEYREVFLRTKHEFQTFVDVSQSLVSILSSVLRRSKGC